MLCFWADFPNLLPPRNPWNNFQVSGSVHDMLNGIDFHWSCSHICGASEMWKKKKKKSCAFSEHRGVIQAWIPGSLSSMETLLNHTCVQDFSTNCSPRRWHLLLTSTEIAALTKIQSWALQICIKSAPEPLNKCLLLFTVKTDIQFTPNMCEPSLGEPLLKLVYWKSFGKSLFN